MSALKKRSLVAFLLVITGPILAMGLASKFGEIAGVVYAAFAMGIGWMIAIRLRCPHCGVRLADSFPYKGGGGVLLWVTKGKCPKCKTPFE